MQLIQALDLAGVAVFAATGALAASRRELDLIGFVFLAGVAGIGGGTVRDLILDVPVFWLADQTYVLVCVAIAVAVHFAAPPLRVALHMAPVARRGRHGGLCGVRGLQGARRHRIAGRGDRHGD